jgi:hypothetical protein
MSRITLKYVEQFTDRHGRPRYYFRRAGHKRTPLPGLPGSAEFMDAYQAALAGVSLNTATGSARTIPGTVNAAIAAFYTRCNSYLDNKPVTQQTDRNILEAFRAKYGNRPIAGLEQRHIENMLAEKSGKPAAQRNLLRVLRALLAFCVQEPIRATSPDWQQATLGARTVTICSGTQDRRGGPWPAEHPQRLAALQAIENRWPIGDPGSGTTCGDHRQDGDGWCEDLLGEPLRAAFHSRGLWQLVSRAVRHGRAPSLRGARAAQGVPTADG